MSRSLPRFAAVTLAAAVLVLTGCATGGTTAGGGETTAAAEDEGYLTPGVITMKLGRLVVVLNATPDRVTQTLPAAAGTAYALHPVQAHGSDPVVKTASYDRGTGAFSVPGRTVAVFERR